jgi:MFS family permease
VLLGQTTTSGLRRVSVHNVQASAPSAMERTTAPVGAGASPALITHSTVYYDKSSQQPSISSAKSVENGLIPRAHQVQDFDRVTEKDGTVLEPVQSRHPSVRDASSIPNGGLWAWLQVLGSFFLLFNSWCVLKIFGQIKTRLTTTYRGIINTFGSYQAYYETDLLRSSSPSSISWIGSIQAFLLLMVGALTGPLFDAGYFRSLLISGSLMLVLGQMMLSLCHEYWQVLLAQAFCIGIGTGALFVPSMAVLTTYFSTRIGLAIGLAASGSSFGGVIYPIVFHQLLPQVGFAWTTRVLGFIMLATMIIPNVCMRIRVLPAKKRSLLDLRAFRIPAYSLQVAGFFCGFMGLYMPFFYAQLYALREHLTTESLAFYLLAVMNSTSTFGRKLRSTSIQ